MRNLLAVLILAALVAPAYAVVDYFPVTGDGSMDTYHNSSSSAVEGYTNAGAGGTPRLGYSKQGHAWLAWDAKNYLGDRTTSVGDTSGLTMAQFLAGNPTATAKLYINLSTPALVGSYALETIRSGNEGVIQEDNGSGTGYGYTNPAAGITGSAQPWAWNAGGPPYVVNGQLKNLVPGPQSTSWIAAGTTSSHYVKQFTIGQPIEFGSPTNPNGYDASMASNGGEAWALACLIGMDWSQSGTDINRARTAGQIVNNTTGDMTTGAAVLFSALNYVGPNSPRLGTPVGNWYAIDLSADLVASLANDPATKALLFNNWFAGTVSTSANPAFVAKDQGDGMGRAFLELTPEPATLVLLAMGGLALLRRRS